MRGFTLTIFLALIVSSLVSVTTAQEKLEESDRATLLFDIDIKRLLQNENVKELGPDVFHDLLVLDQYLPPGCDLGDLTRFCGAVQLTDDYEQLQPFNFHFQLHFTRAETVEEVKKQLPNFAENQFEHNGKTYHSPEPSIYALFEEKFLEIGSKQYMLQPDRDLMVSRLETPWNAIPSEAAIKFAFDTKTARKAIQLIRNGISNQMAMNATMQTVVDTTLDTVNEIDMVVAYADLEMQELLTVQITPQAGSSEKVNGVFNGLLFFAQNGLKSLIYQIPVKSKRGTRALLEMADQLKSEVHNDRVESNVEQPESMVQIFLEDYVPALKVKIQDRQIRRNLINLSRAIFTFQKDDQLPFIRSEQDDWNEDLSWRVRVLPGLFHHRSYQLARVADNTQSWKGQTNQRIIDQMPRQFGSQGTRSNIVWVKSKVKDLTDITDDYRDTISLICLPSPLDFPWTQPEGDHISILAAIKLISELPDGEQLYAVSYGSSIIMLDNTLTTQQLKAYFTPAGGD